mmetsp:Transcript_118425/g.342415  ORF Transcript_118425/g.342415 Transcript_118425/m.342415 type:complete len:365 (+) Transcript_118425:1088-2182(+)
MEEADAVNGADDRLLRERAVPPKFRRALHHRGFRAGLGWRDAAPLEELDEAPGLLPDKQLIRALRVEDACQRDAKLLRAELCVGRHVVDQLRHRGALQKRRQCLEGLAELQEVKDETVHAVAIHEYHEAQRQATTALRIHPLEVNRRHRRLQVVQPVRGLIQLALISHDPHLNLIAIRQLVRPELRQLNTLATARLALVVALREDGAAPAVSRGAHGLRSAAARRHALHGAPAHEPRALGVEAPLVGKPPLRGAPPLRGLPTLRRDPALGGEPPVDGGPPYDRGGPLRRQRAAAGSARGDRQGVGPGRAPRLLGASALLMVGGGRLHRRDPVTSGGLHAFGAALRCLGLLRLRHRRSRRSCAYT